MGSGADAALRVSCENQDDCFGKAQEACPAGFDVVTHEATPAVYQTVPLTWEDEDPLYFGVQAEPEKGQLVFKCHPREEIATSWQRDKAKREREQQELGGELTVAPPSALAGFILGSTLDSAASLCTNAEHDFQSRGEQKGACSGLPRTLPLTGHVLLRACSKENTLCSVEVVGVPEQVSRAKAWLDTLAMLKRELVEKYGKPTAIKRVWPSECRGEELLSCLPAGSARLRYEWAWKDGHTIALAMSRWDSQAAILLRYRTPAYKQQREVAEMGDSL